MIEMFCNCLTEIYCLIDLESVSITSKEGLC